MLLSAHRVLKSIFISIPLPLFFTLKLKIVLEYLLFSLVCAENILPFARSFYLSQSLTPPPSPNETVDLIL